MCKNGKYGLAEILLKLKANPDMRTTKGKTSLFSSLSVNIIDLLIEYGATLNVQCNRGNTILMNCFRKLTKDKHFIMRGGAIIMHSPFLIYPSAITFILHLIEIGADIRVKNVQGKSFATSYRFLDSFPLYKNLYEKMQTLILSKRKSNATFFKSPRPAKFICPKQRHCRYPRVVKCRPKE